MLSVDIYKKLAFFELHINLKLQKGIMVVTGPSGSGKTTLLNCLAGLEKPDTGRISLGERLFFDSYQGVDIPARLRNTGLVFQDYALFPHLTVKRNITYGLKGRCKGESGRYRFTIRDIMEMLKITHLQERYPQHLSGGEKQRVALARALMTEPDLLLLDEPLSALDTKTRTELQRELKEMQRLWQIPFLLVTHDREEARRLGDGILYLNRGLGLEVEKAGQIKGRW